MDMMGSHIIVFSDSDVIADVMERRSAVYADKVCKHPASMAFTLTNRDVTWQPRMPMVNELYELPYSSATTQKNHDLSQDGMHLVLSDDALRGHMAYPPQTIPPLFQRRGHRPT